MATITETVGAREITHGNFKDHARITQCLKLIIDHEVTLRMQRQQPPLTYAQKESLDMIAHKIGRIIAGESSFTDHWIDISGYAEIANK